MQHRIYLNNNPEYVEFYEDKARKFRWRVVAANGEVVGASSESFYDKQNALDNLKLTLRIATEALATLPGDV